MPDKSRFDSINGMRIGLQMPLHIAEFAARQLRIAEFGV
jgi:hypothetical protein